jgi:hypothetical protein
VMAAAVSCFFFCFVLYLIISHCGRGGMRVVWKLQFPDNFRQKTRFCKALA